MAVLDPYRIEDGNKIQEQLINEVYELRRQVAELKKIVIEYKKLEEKLKYLSFHDSLTGLYNRNYFEEEMKRLNTTRKYPVGIIIIDIDNLKFVNDTFGHVKGDELIKYVANILSSIFRKEDVVARIGGDEFAVILPNVNEKIVQSLCKRIKDNCNRNNNPLKVSVSLGYDIQYGQYKDIKEVFKMADSRMYKDKNGKKWAGS
ncbi:PAS/PAC sensor-containing diguanylate cyclase [Candidatus Desulfofervidus auxilii]|uniref:diguanylate cyclase n=1 Tax=Desulfofervidus auxilii TaxID=1621989 RepID=A0A7U4QJK8_DESA2|nr:GGDEF domain-containing protein [Candidatus Desulfofervidus auxilii]AMM40557.1 PAS/PAC sensor-containing diguanylate cyclase [Candidatus Desulfofervidus auxilii]